MLDPAALLAVSDAEDVRVKKIYRMITQDEWR